MELRRFGEQEENHLPCKNVHESVPQIGSSVWGEYLVGKGMTLSVATD